MQRREGGANSPRRNQLHRFQRVSTIMPRVLSHYTARHDNFIVFFHQYDIDAKSRSGEFNGKFPFRERTEDEKCNCRGWNGRESLSQRVIPMEKGIYSPLHSSNWRGSRRSTAIFSSPLDIVSILYRRKRRERELEKFPDSIFGRINLSLFSTRLLRASDSILPPRKITCLRISLGLAR